MAVTYNDILQAFPLGKPWTGPIRGCAPEIIDIERDLRNCIWSDVATKLCNRHSDAYIMLELEPLAYFLPAFLRAAVDDSNGAAAEFLVYFVCSDSADDLLLRLTDQQRDVTMAVTAWLLSCDDGYFASGEREKFTAKLRRWKRS